MASTHCANLKLRVDLRLNLIKRDCSCDGAMAVAGAGVGRGGGEGAAPGQRAAAARRPGGLGLVETGHVTTCSPLIGPGP